MRGCQENDPHLMQHLIKQYSQSKPINIVQFQYIVFAYNCVRI